MLAIRKGDFWYNQAKLIYGVASADSTLTDPAWTIGSRYGGFGQGDRRG